ncbi:glycosyltransferase family 4 protein [Mycolicibacterium poriferae]|uniref:Glycoside hydrolase n=1 Tax=Mycolicibacterium poriferae TaxID=39694 RepID=A0A6N4V7T6_9MYCO|nr:glycosyltransferase family 4 protein [Mycolicibacterium poriferae]MCV7263600.1 glycosyltransferase family 4 protein [Mycolicibacterium poriferae]BBX50945.1 glycoside hydrolase [Mycolicibacterium poriferae]
MNILMLCKAFPPITGGVETYSEQIAKAYLARGAEVTVITQSLGQCGWGVREYPEGKVALFNTGAGGQGVTALKMLRVVDAVAKVNSFDFIHATTWRPAMIPVALRRDEQIVISAHGRELLIVPRILAPIMWAVFRRANIVVAVSSATLERAKRQTGRKIDTTRWLVAANGLSYASGNSGVESAAEERITLSRPVRFLTLARLVERKNVQGCIRAFQTLKAAGVTDFQYRVAGTGPLARELEEQCEKAGLMEHVRFLGYVESDDVPRLYASSDVFLHPQIDLEDNKDFEGFGLSIADAMSFGCLAIAGNGSGPSDFIEDGKTGLLVDGTNQIQLVNTINAVIKDPEAHVRIASAGKAYVTEVLSWDKHVETIFSALRG